MEPPESLVRRTRGGRRRNSSPDGPGERRADARARSEPCLGVGRSGVRRGAVRGRRATTRDRNPGRVRRRRGAAAHPRRLESQLPRAPDALLARTRRTRRGGTAAARAEMHAETFGLPLANAMAHRAAAAVSLASRNPADAVEQALASARPQTRSAPQSRPPSLESSWAAHWQRPGRPNVLWSSSTAAADLRTAAPCDTAQQQSANSEFSVTTSTGAAAPERPAESASKRSHRESARSRGSWSIERRIRRSPRHSSSARRRSRRTSATSFASSKSPHASR